jgi:PAS domain S-box-containing protein
MQDGTTNEEMPVGGVGPLRPREARLEQVSYRPASHPDAQPRREAALHAGGGTEAQTDMGWTPPEWERVFDAAGDAIFLTDRQFRIARANRATSQLLGKPLAEILGKTYSQAIHGTDQPPETCPLAQAHHTKTHVQGEIYVGQRAVWLEVSVDPMLDENGDVTGVLHILRDVTDGKKMKEAMRESEEKYRNLFENAREAIVLTDLNGTITGVNRLVEDYGFQREQLIGKGLFDFVAEDDRTRALADFKVLLGGKPVAGEMDVLTPKGVFSIEYRDNAIIRGGQIVGVQAILTDVTKRKRAEQLLREERDRVQKYLDIAGVLLIVIDTEERVGLINKKGREILGYTEQEILGKNWFDNFLPPRIRARTRAIFDGLMAGQADENEYAEGVVLTQDGRERIMGWHNTLLQDEAGRILGTLSSGEDITKRRQAEEGYRSLVDHSLQGLVIFQDGKAVFANQAMAKITGYAIDEMLAMSAEQVRDCVHPEDREIVWQNHRRRLAGELVPEHYEMRGIRKDGLVCWLDIHASRIDYRGKSAIQAAYIDITERKHADQLMRTLATAAMELVELPAEADLFQFIGEKVLALIGRGVVSVNSIEGDTLTVRQIAGATTVAMKLAQRLLGRAVIGMPMKGLHEAARTNLLTGKLTKVEGGLYELFFHTVPRPVCWTLEKGVGIQECHAIGIRRPGTLFGNVTILTQKGTELNAGVIETFVNQASVALERRRAEEVVRESEVKYRELFENAREAIVIFNLEKTITDVNKFVETYGFRQEDLIGRNYIEFVAAPYRERRSRILSCCGRECLWKANSR